MGIDLSGTMSAATYKRLEMLWSNQTLPPRQSRTLLEIWSADKPAAVKKADEANLLLPLLTSYSKALDRAVDIQNENPHLAEFEVLELAGLPLRFPG